LIVIQTPYEEGEQWTLSMWEVKSEERKR
jgi:hypothetical protein